VWSVVCECVVRGRSLCCGFVSVCVSGLCACV